MPVAYNPATLAQSVKTLEGRADRIVLVYALAGLALAYVAQRVLPGVGGVPWELLGVGFIIGGLVGEGKAFETRLRAQLVACLVAIEANTRAVR